MDNSYSGHFTSPRRFVYALLPQPVAEHIHYIIGCIVNAESPYYIDNAFDNGNGDYAIRNRIDMNTLYPITSADNNEGYYRIRAINDTGSLYNIITCGDYNA